MKPCRMLRIKASIPKYSSAPKKKKNDSAQMSAYSGTALRLLPAFNISSHGKAGAFPWMYHQLEV